jgi:hypothetical protein
MLLTYMCHIASCKLCESPEFYSIVCGVSFIFVSSYFIVFHHFSLLQFNYINIFVSCKVVTVLNNVILLCC